MPASWPTDVLDATQSALTPLSNKKRAEPMASYMKDVAPFLGIQAPERRRALRRAWKSLRMPSSDELGEAAITLMALDEREYHYAASDLIARYRSVANEYFLDAFVTDLLATKPWWDTVDALVTGAVSPMCQEFDADWLINEWSNSQDRWLIRAAITHQRGWKQGSNVNRVLGLCDRHWENQEFFVAKAVGWALRDLAWVDPKAVQTFLAQHRARNSVARREAQRGLDAQGRSRSHGVGIDARHSNTFGRGGCTARGDRRIH